MRTGGEDSSISLSTLPYILVDLDKLAEHTPWYTPKSPPLKINYYSIHHFPPTSFSISTSTVFRESSQLQHTFLQTVTVHSQASRLGLSNNHFLTYLSCSLSKAALHCTALLILFFSFLFFCLVVKLMNGWGGWDGWVGWVPLGSAHAGLFWFIGIRSCEFILFSTRGGQNPLPVLAQTTKKSVPYQKTTYYHHLADLMAILPVSTSCLHRVGISLIRVRISS